MIFRKKRAKKIKISEMLLNFAGNYILMGEDIEEKQQYLNGVVSAWNIACLNEKDRERSIKKYMSEYRKLNPLQSKRDFRDVEEDLRLYLSRGRRYSIQKCESQIVNAHIQEVDGKIHVTVASLSRN
jgi:hypothetical protein